MDKIIGVLKRISVKNILSLIIVGGAIIAAVIIIIHDSKDINWENISVNPIYMFIGYLIATSSLIISIPIWRSILKSYGINSTVKEDILFYNLGLLGYSIPGGIWAIASRVSLYSAKKHNGNSVIVAGVLETLITGIASLGLYAISSMFIYDFKVLKSPYIVSGIGLLTVFLLHPKVFSKVSKTFLMKSANVDSIDVAPYSLKQLLIWVAGEACVILLGSTGLFFLLKSFIDVGNVVWFSVLIAWTAANAVSALFFWLPGTPVLRDGAIAFILSFSIPLASAIIFVVIQRIWTFSSLLVNALIVWILLGNSLGVGLNNIFRTK